MNYENICLIIFIILLLIFINMIYNDSKKTKQNTPVPSSNPVVLSAKKDNETEKKYDPCEGDIEDSKKCKEKITSDISELNNLCKQDLSDPVLRKDVCSVSCDKSKYFKIAYDKSSCLNVCGKCNR